jgi:hypothetical protein
VAGGGELAPYLVVREPVQGQVPQPAVLRLADAVLAVGAAAVAEFEVGELPAPVLVTKQVKQWPSGLEPAFPLRRTRAADRP